MSAIVSAISHALLRKGKTPYAVRGQFKPLGVEKTRMDGWRLSSSFVILIGF
mgnify:CR=1 FL=1